MSNTNTATGVITEIRDEIQVTDKFRKREFVLEITDGQRQQPILFELHQDKTDLIDPYNEGETVTVHYNLRGRKWERDGEVKYFNTLAAWCIQKA
jgi:single-strand DNA-binding protein